MKFTLSYVLLFQDRLDTLQSVREAGISVCAGGIIGLGEGPKDRVGLIHQLATLPEHPESVPINALVAVAGMCFVHFDCYCVGCPAGRLLLLCACVWGIVCRLLRYVLVFHESQVGCCWPLSVW